MGQPRIVHGTTQWYLIARNGDMMLRVHAGMPLGETETGELSFDPSCAQLELGIASDGGLMLSALNDHELESAGGARRRQEVLARDRRAEISLPHNVLRLVTDFVDPAQPDETVEVRRGRRVEVTWTPEAPRPDADFIEAQQPQQSEQCEETSKVHHRRPRPSPVVASLIGLCGVGLMLVYLAFREDGPQGPPETVDTIAAPRIAPVEAPSIAPANAAPNSAVPSVALSPPTLLQPRDEPTVTEPEIREEVVESGDESQPAPVTKPAIEPVTKPIAKPAVQRRVDRTSNPAADKTAAADEAAPAPRTKASQQTATVAPNPEVISDSANTRAQAVELARQRALFAADQALAQGRLMTPPESSAYTLYSRVLAIDPGSPQANSGLQSVRQALINRAMAQLAANALDDARRSLQEATDAGADRSLVAHLRDEVDYRQRQIDARVAR